MIAASEETLLAMFRSIHGELSGSCYEEIVYDEEGDIQGVACMKNGNEAWRASLSEIAFDTAAAQFLLRQAEEAKP